MLVLPGGTEMAIEVGIFFQSRIPVGREHFAVGIDIDAFSFASV